MSTILWKDLPLQISIPLFGMTQNFCWLIGFCLFLFPYVFAHLLFFVNFLFYIGV